MAFVKFTDPSNKDVWIAPHWITRVRTPITGRHEPNAKALIVMGNAEQAVLESVDQVMKALEGARDA
jgi:hypothetical protein